MTESPWTRPIRYAQVEFSVAAGALPEEPITSPRAWRGAVITQLSRQLSGADLEPWTQRDHQSGECVRTPPRILYRVRRSVPVLYLLGPRVDEWIRILATGLKEVVLPTGEIVPVVWMRPHAYDGEVRHLGDGWAVYRLASPYFPCDAVVRRSFTAGNLHGPWAGYALTSSLREAAEHWGLESLPRRPVYAHILGDVTLRRCEWARPDRGEERRATGFSATFASNLLLPQGIGVGSKVSEGWGELELLDVRRPK